MIYDLRFLLSTFENLLFDILQAYIAVRQTFLVKMADFGRHFGLSAILDLEGNFDALNEFSNPKNLTKPASKHIFLVVCQN